MIEMFSLCDLILSPSPFPLQSHRLNFLSSLLFLSLYFFAFLSLLVSMLLHTRPLICTGLFISFVKGQFVWEFERDKDFLLVACARSCFAFFFIRVPK